MQSMESYKQLMRENLQLQTSFKVIIQRLEHANEKLLSDDQENQLLREQVDSLEKKVSLLNCALNEPNRIQFQCTLFGTIDASL